MKHIFSRLLSLTPLFIGAVVLSLTLTGCKDDPYPRPFDNHNSYEVNEQGFIGGHAPRAKSSLMAMSADSMVAAAPESMILNRDQFKGRKIAETHSLQIDVDHEKLQETYYRDLKTCLSFGCQLINSNVNTSGHAYINARIAPEKLEDYIKAVTNTPGMLKSHTVSADDKTIQYSDASARLANQEALKQRLYKLLDDPRSKKINEILQIERELTRVQSAIDREKGQLRSLQKITDMATVNTRYSSVFPPVSIEYPDLLRSFALAWKHLITNLAHVIEFIGFILPWIPIAFVGLWLVIKMFSFALSKTFLKMITFWKKETPATTPKPTKKKSTTKK